MAILSTIIPLMGYACLFFPILRSKAENSLSKDVYYSSTDVNSIIPSLVVTPALQQKQSLRDKTVDKLALLEALRSIPVSSLEFPRGASTNVADGGSGQGSFIKEPEQLPAGSGDTLPSTESKEQKSTPANQNSDGQTMNAADQLSKHFEENEETNSKLPSASDIQQAKSLSSDGSHNKIFSDGSQNNILDSMENLSHGVTPPRVVTEVTFSPNGEMGMGLSSMSEVNPSTENQKLKVKSLLSPLSKLLSFITEVEQSPPCSDDNENVVSSRLPIEGPSNAQQPTNNKVEMNDSSGFSTHEGDFNSEMASSLRKWIDQIQQKIATKKSLLPSQPTPPPARTTFENQVFYLNPMPSKSPLPQNSDSFSLLNKLLETMSNDIERKPESQSGENLLPTLPKELEQKLLAFLLKNTGSSKSEPQAGTVAQKKHFQRGTQTNQRNDGKSEMSKSSSNEANTPSQITTTPSQITTTPSQIITTPSSQTITTPSSHTITTPSSQTVTTPSSQTVTTPSSQTITTPSSQTITTPSSQTITTPSSQAITTPSSQAITTPSSQAITTPSSQAITTPSSQAITTPSSQAITTPSSQTVTTPSSQTITTPSSQITTTPSTPNFPALQFKQAAQQGTLNSQDSNDKKQDEIQNTNNNDMEDMKNSVLNGISSMNDLTTSFQINSDEFKNSKEEILDRSMENKHIENDAVIASQLSPLKFLLGGTNKEKHPVAESAPKLTQGLPNNPKPYQRPVTVSVRPPGKSQKPTTKLNSLKRQQELPNENQLASLTRRISKGLKAKIFKPENAQPEKSSNFRPPDMVEAEPEGNNILVTDGGTVLTTSKPTSQPRKSEKSELFSSLTNIVNPSLNSQFGGSLNPLPSTQPNIRARNSQNSMFDEGLLQELMLGAEAHQESLSQANLKNSLKEGNFVKAKEKLPLKEQINLEKPLPKRNFLQQQLGVQSSTKQFHGDNIQSQKYYHNQIPTFQGSTIPFHQKGEANIISSKEFKNPNTRIDGQGEMQENLDSTVEPSGMPFRIPNLPSELQNLTSEIQILPLGTQIATPGIENLLPWIGYMPSWLRNLPKNEFPKDIMSPHVSEKKFINMFDRTKYYHQSNDITMGGTKTPQLPTKPPTNSKNDITPMPHTPASKFSNPGHIIKNAKSTVKPSMKRDTQLRMNRKQPGPKNLKFFNLNGEGQSNSNPSLDNGVQQKSKNHDSSQAKQKINKNGGYRGKSNKNGKFSLGVNPIPNILNTKKAFPQKSLLSSVKGVNDILNGGVGSRNSNSNEPMLVSANLNGGGEYYGSNDIEVGGEIDNPISNGSRGESGVQGRNDNTHTIEAGSSNGKNNALRAPNWNDVDMNVNGATDKFNGIGMSGIFPLNQQGNNEVLSMELDKNGDTTLNDIFLNEVPAALEHLNTALLNPNLRNPITTTNIRNGKIANGSSPPSNNPPSNNPTTNNPTTNNPTRNEGNGNMVNDNISNENKADDNTHNDNTPIDDTANGSNANGNVPSRNAPNDNAPNNSGSKGNTSNGNTSNGNTSNGNTSNINTFNINTFKGNPPIGDTPNENTSNGNNDPQQSSNPPKSDDYYSNNVFSSNRWK